MELVPYFTEIRRKTGVKIQQRFLFTVSPKTGLLYGKCFHKLRIKSVKHGNCNIRSSLYFYIKVDSICIPFLKCTICPTR